MAEISVAHTEQPKDLEYTVSGLRGMQSEAICSIMSANEQVNEASQLYQEFVTALQELLVGNTVRVSGPVCSAYIDGEWKPVSECGVSTLVEELATVTCVQADVDIFESPRVQLELTGCNIRAVTVKFDEAVIDTNV